MSDFIIISGDMLKITMMPPVVAPMIVAPIPLIGTGPTVMGMNKPVCVKGDEMPPFLLPPMPYISPPFVIPGMGTLQIMLMPNNTTMTSKFGGKPALLKGAVFQAKFQVMVPAIFMAGPVPTSDPVPVKMGTCQFITTNVTIMAG
jgi:hypothetical protein